MGQRDDLLQQVQKLQGSLKDLQSRVSALESSLSPDQHMAPANVDGPMVVVDPPADQFPSDPWDNIDFGRLMTLMGRSIMVLASAFLLRFITDSSVVPPIPGVMLGVALGIGLILLSIRSGMHHDRLSANAHGLTAVIIVYPLIFETVVTLKIIPILLGAGFLAIVTAAGLLAAWHQSLRGLAWAFVLGTLAICLALISSTGEYIVFTILLLGLGAASCILAYSRRWHLMRWVVAATLGLALIRLVAMASGAAGGLPSGQNPRDIQILCLISMSVYLGIFSWRALVQGRGVKVFDVVQSAAILIIGFGGAVRIAQTNGGGTGLIGFLALLGAVAGYTVAFAFITNRHGRGRGFFYFATLALVFLFLGSLVIVHGSWLIWCWITLGLATSALGGQFHRVTLRYHAAVYLTLAAVQSGLIKSAFLAFLVPATGTWSHLSVMGIVTFGALVACYLILVITQQGKMVAFTRRLPRLVIASLLLGGVGYFAVLLLVSLLTTIPPTADSALLALSRTLIIALTTILLAAAARRCNLVEFGWLIYPLLLFGCAKLALEDLQEGSAFSLALAFAALGGALILGPRLLRSGSPASESHTEQGA